MRELLKETFPDQEIDLRATRESLALVGRASTQAIADKALALISATVKDATNLLQVPPPAPERQVLLRVRFAELNRSVASEFGVSLLSTGARWNARSNFDGPVPVGRPPNAVAGSGSTSFSLSDILNIFAFRPDLKLGVVIRDLQARGLLQILAEPNLIATNGKEASFLAGGEFPVPITQGGATAGAVTVQYHEFGIRLRFSRKLRQMER